MKKKWFIIVPLIAAVIVLFSALYTVKPNQYVVIRQLGRVVSVQSEPGLKFKIPFVQSVQVIDGRIVLYDIPESQIITKDKKSMIADNFVLWKVTDPTAYIRTLNAIEARATERIEAAVYNALKNTLSSMTQDEIIEARGERLTTMLTNEANSDLKQYGVEVVTSQIKVLGLPSDNEEAVYNRMISERNNIAAAYTASGQSEAQKIRNATDKEVQIKLAEAEKQAEILKAEGEQTYMQILQDAYNSEDKASFYEYIRSLDALKISLKGNKTLILDKDSELAKILYGN